MGKFKVESNSKTVKDSQGNLIETTESKVFKISSSEEEPFFMLYCNQLAGLYNITSLTAIKLLAKFMENSDFNTGLVRVSSALRMDIMKDLNISKSALSRAIQTLVDSDTLGTVEDEIEEVDPKTGENKTVLRKGEYYINPQIMGKGDRSKRSEFLKKNCVVTINAE